VLQLVPEQVTGVSEPFAATENAETLFGVKADV
jgi:hypothetical protein